MQMSEPLQKWKILNKKELFHQRFFAVENITCHHPAKDMTHEFFCVKTRDWINVVATTEDGRYILVRQHRIGTDDITLETPGGVIEPDEAPEIAASRELEEETGYKPRSIHHIQSCAVNPAMMNNHVHFFYAPDCIKVSGQNLDSVEDIEVVAASEDEVMEMMRDGRICHSLAVTSLLLHFQFRK
jgi:8-oxo-dGTP pyrophosphatase MutT (NUDIX family)